MRQKSDRQADHLLSTASAAGGSWCEPSACPASEERETRVLSRALPPPPLTIHGHAAVIVQPLEQHVAQRRDHLLIRIVRCQHIALQCVQTLVVERALALPTVAFREVHTARRK